MRTRLSIHLLSLLAFGLLLWQMQSVLGQKYYMNFAFNNNNPDANGNGEDESQEDPRGSQGNDNDLESGSEQDEGDDSDSDDGNDDDDEGSDKTNENNKSASDDDKSGGGNDHRGSKGKAGLDVSNDSGMPIVDDDEDDSDSQDRGNRQRNIGLEDNDGPDAHSHHSSYEISIDDSFGGRYVRSIYESSESHGHSGSNPGSGSVRLRTGAQDDGSSSNVQTYGDEDYEEFNED